MLCLLGKEADVQLPHQVFSSDHAGEAERLNSDVYGNGTIWSWFFMKFTAISTV